MTTSLMISSLSRLTSNRFTTQSLHFSDKKVCDRLESVTDPSFLSRSDDGNDDDLANGMEYDHDYLSDPLNATVVPFIQ